MVTPNKTSDLWIMFSNNKYANAIITVLILIFTTRNPYIKKEIASLRMNKENIILRPCELNAVRFLFGKI